MIGRRTLLAGLGAVTVACTKGPWRCLTAAEARTLEAACAQLIPADRDPGAKEAGAVNYIDLQLSTRLKRFRQPYRRGIAAVDDTARAQFGKPFAELSSGQQVDILKAIEKSARPFFDLLLNHTRQGFYGDPRHGGNRNMASWKMLGLPYPQLRGRQHYEG